MPPTEAPATTNLITGNRFDLSPLSDLGTMQLMERSTEARMLTDLAADEATWDLHYNREHWARNSIFVRMGSHTAAVPWSLGSVRYDSATRTYVPIEAHQ